MKFLCTISLLTILTQCVFAQQRVGIGTLTPDSSAQLELASNNKGVLIPRMTSAQRQMIPNPTNGLLVFDVTTDGFWYFDGVQWVQPFGITGPQGPVGNTGIAGIVGEQGPTGLPSVIVGPQGVVGITGPQGVQGITGAIGLQGAIGADGITGITGPQGIVGPIGAQGIAGIIGSTGAIGNMGPQGIVGITGIIGPQGLIGETGPTGPLGPPSFNTAIAIDPFGIMTVTDPATTLSATASAWMILGNGGTNPTNNFVGTTDGQDLNVATAGIERMRVLANGDVWVDGSKPFMIRRYFCNNCDNPNRNTGVSVNDYVAFIAGFYPTSDDGDSSADRARVYSNGTTWWFKGDLADPGDEDWNVDIIFVKLEMADDQRPNSAQGGGTAF